ncbi:MAG: hypothetical protein WC421_00820 [Elusimicrobiales bacterium]
MISAKPAEYLIDGLNYVRSHLDAGGPGEDDAVRDFLDWLDCALSGGGFAGSRFRVVLDGGWRDAGPVARGSLKVDFSGHESADDILVECALYLKHEGQRAFIVTSDRALQERARRENLLVMNCAKFEAMCRSRIPEK